jgi:molybdopterin/thiamine biosynthesis adenylyltransferase
MDTEKLLHCEFSRNVGLLSEEDQKKLLASRIAVAGAGGVGGIHALTLARLGIGNFTIADPDTFEAVNISRQFGAFHSSFDRNKADVIGEMILDINPQADVRVMRECVTSENVDSFLADVDIFIDGIDFFEIDARRRVFARCREKGIFAITAAPLGFGATRQIFSPAGMTFDDYFGITDTMEYEEKLAAFAAGLAPRPYHIKYLDLSKVSFAKKTGPAVSPACTLAASLVAVSVVEILTGKGKLKPVPHYLQIDLLRGKHKKGYLFMGGKNPLQRLIKRLILRKAKAAAKGV